MVNTTESFVGFVLRTNYVKIYNILYSTVYLCAPLWIRYTLFCPIEYKYFVWQGHCKTYIHAPSIVILKPTFTPTEAEGRRELV
jgi:hypothetical protein